MPSRPPRASRRAVLTGGAGLALAATAAGCGLARDGDHAGAASTDPTAPAVDADSDLVVAVTEDIAGTAALVAATGRATPSLRPLTRRLAGLHEAHLRELGGGGDGGSARAKGTPQEMRARLLRSEERLQRRLVEAALAAESGALAQVFASMAAAIAQERTVAG